MSLAALAVSAIYLGGGGADDCDDIMFDRAGFAYLACHSSSESFTGPEKKDFDAYVVKFDPRTSQIRYATRIGGSAWDGAFRVVVDARDRVWISGTTQSADFPRVPPGRQSGQGSIQAFVARLGSGGTVEDMAVIGDATAEGLAVAADGTAYLAGTKAPSEEKHNAYVAEIREGGSPRILLVAAGTATGIELDRRGSLFAAGFDGQGAFVTSVDLRLWKTRALRRVGEADGDRARAIAVDRRGRAHVLGTASSPGLCASGAISGKSDIFVAGFSADLSKVLYCTLFGGSADDVAGFNGGSLKVDSRGNLWFSGLTRSPDLKAQGRYAGADDGVVASWTRNGRALRFASYFGGEGSELLEAIALAPDGAVWATGITSSRSLASPGYRGGRTDAILVKWANGAKLR